MVFSPTEEFNLRPTWHASGIQQKKMDLQDGRGLETVYGLETESFQDFEEKDADIWK